MKLLAPNGKPSNLTPEQYRLVRTPAFKAWFGDWENSPETASKVVDENGEPLVCNHSSREKNIDIFYGGRIFRTKKNQVKPIWFTYKEFYEYADGEDIIQYRCFLNIKNIFDYSKQQDEFNLKRYFIEQNGEMLSDYDFNMDWDAQEQFNLPAYIYEMGYDGYKFTDEYSIVIFNSNQIKLADGTNTTFDSNNPDIRYKSGGSLSKTPAPKKERIYGSKINKPKSSESKRKASSIILSPKVISSINSILEKHNEKSNKKIPLATAKAVVRRGMGAYSSTHRPTISGGKPNSRVAWGLARLNAFIYKIQKGYSKSGKYNQDDDLINELGYRVKKYENGGNIKSNKFMMWLIEWYKPISDKINITFSLPNILTPFNEENVVIMDLFEKIDQNIDAKEYLKTITNKADEYGVIIYLEPMPRYKYFLKNIEKRKKISKEYLISYYKKFDFELNADSNSMKRLPKLEKGSIIEYEKINISELEKILGRKINIFNENIVNVNGILYQKVFLKPEYKIISF